MFKRIAIVMGVCMLSTVPFVQAPAQEGLGERLGRELDEKLSTLSRELQEGWSKVEKLVDQLEVRGRVYARVHWDKVLTSQPITIEIEDASVVVMTGQVSDEEARKKAVRLAEDTVGVTKVIDRLQVKIEISPPVLTYHRPGKRVQLVDRSFLFYRKYGAQSWPWDEGEEIQNDLAGATPLDIFAD